MGKGANSSSLNWGGTTQACRSISIVESAAAIDVTTLADSEHKYVAGAPDVELTFDLYGQTSIDTGDTATVTVTFADSTTAINLGEMVCTGVDLSGEQDGAIVSRLTAKPYAS